MANSSRFRNILTDDECPVCFESVPLNELPCGHRLCQTCINRITVANKITCPQCREQTPIPEDGFPSSSKGILRPAVKRVLIELYGTDNPQCALCKDEIYFRCDSCSRFLCSSCMVSTDCRKSQYRDRRHDGLDVEKILARKESDLKEWVANGQNKIEEMKMEISRLKRQKAADESSQDLQIGLKVSAVNNFKQDLEHVQDTVQRIILIEANNQVLDRHRAACSECRGTPRGSVSAFFLCPLTLGYHSPAEMQAQASRLIADQYGTDEPHCGRCREELTFRCDSCVTFLCSSCMIKTNCPRSAGQTGRHNGLEIRKLLARKEEELSQWEKINQDKVKSLKIEKTKLKRNYDLECSLLELQIMHIEMAIRTVTKALEETGDAVHRIIFIEAKLYPDKRWKVWSWCRGAVRRALWRRKWQIFWIVLALIVFLLIAGYVYTVVFPKALFTTFAEDRNQMGESMWERERREQKQWEMEREQRKMEREQRKMEREQRKMEWEQREMESEQHESPWRTHSINGWIIAFIPIIAIITCRFKPYRRR